MDAFESERQDIIRKMNDDYANGDRMPYYIMESAFDGMNTLCKKIIVGGADTNEDKILTQAIEYYGEPAQVVKAIEELAELGKQLGLAIESDNPVVNEYIVHICSLFINVEGIARAPALVGDVSMEKHPFISHLIEELADVSIMLDQLKLIFDPTGTEFPKAREFKLQRLAKRITGDDSQ